MKLLWLFLLCINVLTLSAQQFVVRGRITDAKTGEILSDANVFERIGGTGMASNTYGLYSITLKRGISVLQCSMLGYITKVDTLNITSGRVVDFALQPDSYLLNGVEVRGNRKHGGQLSLGQKDIQAMPSIGGEPDLMKSLQYLPGVSSGNNGTNNISIRGGDQWGNLVLLDEAVVYNPNHALSFFSVFNNDAIQKVNLYKSYFPLTYGGRASAVLDVRMREGNTKEQQRSATVGLIASKLLWEGPFKDRKGSYLISGRVAYPGAALNLVSIFNRSILKNKMMFYDVNAKINRTIDERNRIYFSIYNGGDYTEFNKLVRGYGMSWGNATATLRWNRILNEKVNTNFAGVFSNYYYRYESLRDGLRYLWKSNMQSYQLKYGLEYVHSNNLSIKTGAALHLFSTMPGSVSKNDTLSNIVPYRMERKKMFDASVYGEVEYKFATRLRLNAGIRLTALTASRSAYYESETYFLPKPRAELSFDLTPQQKFHISYNQASQHLHMLSNSSVGLPSDSWLPVNSQIKPATMRQLAAGYEISFRNGKYLCSVEGYYRKTRNIIDFKEHADLFLNDQIEQQIETGTSRGYGIEFYVGKQSGKLTGWLSYTYARAYNRISTIEEGAEYRSAYDRPHNLKLFLNYNLKQKWSFSSTFSYSSGMNLTLPIGQYVYNENLFYIYSSRNGYRAPAFHQWDLSATYRFRKGSLSCSLINVYNRRNVFSIYAGRTDNKSSARTPFAYKIYLYGMVPSISYEFKF